MSKTHLDVGFTAPAHAVRRRYLDEFFPRAVAVAAELRARGGPARMRWTTGSWILSEALAAADRSHRRELELAIEAGDLCWHAMPFTLHTEYCDRSLLAHGLGISAELDRRFGRRTRGAKVTDVPGHTRGLVSLLAEHGVDFLHVGVNPASSAPSVPLRFRWRDDAATRPPGAPAPEITVMYQPGSYGDVQVVPGTGVAVVVHLTGDNVGPSDVTQVEAHFDLLARRFPDATLEAGTLEDVAALLCTVDDLPVVTGEIGDTWIQGVGSDPAKTAAFRALCRERAGWLADGSVSPEDPALREASTQLLLVAEHTWGLDQKTHWPDQEHWSVDALAAVRSDPSTVYFEQSWAEQREYLDGYVESLRSCGRDDLAVRAAEVLAEATTAPVADVVGLDPVDPGHPVELAGARITLDPADGAVVGWCDDAGREWASPDSPLGRLRWQTFDAADFERWFATYNGGTLAEDEWWARWDNTKPGLDSSGATSGWWRTRLVGAWTGIRDGARVLVAETAVVAGSADPVAPPARLRTTISTGPTGAVFELSWADKPAARWPEAVWWAFAPVVGDAGGWTMEKVGETVHPLDVVEGGGRHLHCADALVHAGDGVQLDLLDTGLVAPGRPRLLEWDVEPPDLSGGWHVCLFDNVWGTNFPMWTSGDARFRVRLRTA